MRRVADYFGSNIQSVELPTKTIEQKRTREQEVGFPLAGAITEILPLDVRSSPLKTID
jgi:hypothetical protein